MNKLALALVFALAAVCYATEVPLAGLVNYAVLAVLAAALYYAAVELPKPSFVVHTSGAILITGASSGIGLHAAAHLAAKGFTVFAGVRKAADGEAAVQECVKEHGAEAGKNLVPIILDVTKHETIDSALATVSQWVEQHKQPFVGLVNNAGISTRGVVEMTPLQGYRDSKSLRPCFGQDTSKGFTPHLCVLQ